MNEYLADNVSQYSIFIKEDQSNELLIPKLCADFVCVDVFHCIIRDKKKIKKVKKKRKKEKFTEFKR